MNLVGNNYFEASSWFDGTGYAFVPYYTDCIITWDVTKHPYLNNTTIRVVFEVLGYDDFWTSGSATVTWWYAGTYISENVETIPIVGLGVHTIDLFCAGDFTTLTAWTGYADVYVHSISVLEGAFWTNFKKQREI